jgi:hypothetical protein
MIVAGRVRLLEHMLREWVTPLLKKHGFKKAGLSYETENPETIVIINYQRSRDGQSCDRFTVNLGIGSKRIFEIEDRRVSNRTPVELSHWRMRLGRALAEPSNAWWELCDAADMAQVGHEQREILMNRALPLLERMASDAALREEWKQGKAPGLTELERLLNLSVLLNNPERRKEQRAVIRELKDLAAQTGFGGRVAVRLEDLGIE